jgi:hypothetical protein
MSMDTNVVTQNDSFDTSAKYVKGELTRILVGLGAREA